jgi:hypothetical protein
VVVSHQYLTLQIQQNKTENHLQQQTSPIPQQFPQEEKSLRIDQYEQNSGGFFQSLKK